MSDIIELDPDLASAIDLLPGDATLDLAITKGLAAAGLKANDRLAARQLRRIMAYGSDEMLRLLPLRSTHEGIFSPDEWAELLKVQTPDRIREAGRRGAALSSAVLVISIASIEDPTWDDLAIEIARNEALMIETLLGHDLFTPVCRKRPDLATRMLLDLARTRPEGEIKNGFRTFADAGFTAAFAALWLALPRDRLRAEIFDRIGRPMQFGGAQHGNIMVALSRATSNHAIMEMRARLPDLATLIEDPTSISGIEYGFMA